MNTVKGQLNNLTGSQASHRGVADHEIEHIQQDVDGAALAILGAVREGKLADGRFYFQTNLGLVPVGKGEPRTYDDHLRMAKGPTVLSERDIKNINKLRR